FNGHELDKVMRLMKPLETKGAPFRKLPPKNERPHWVQPKLVAQVRFTEWTADGILRHPVYLGLRDDKKAEEVTREMKTEVRSKKGEGRSTNLVEQLRFLEDAKRDAFVTLP